MSLPWLSSGKTLKSGTRDNNLYFSFHRILGADALGNVIQIRMTERELELK